MGKRANADSSLNVSFVVMVQHCAVLYDLNDDKSLTCRFPVTTKLVGNVMNVIKNIHNCFML